MAKINIDDFYSYKFLSGIRWAPGGKRAAFVAAQCVPEDNNYKSNIWLYENGSARPFTAMDSESSFFWEDEYNLIFPAVRSASDRKRAEKKETFTAYYRLDIRGGEASKAYELPIKSGEITFLPDGRAYTTAPIDCRWPDKHLMTKEEIAAADKEAKAESDYEVIEHLPWWHNGDTFSYRKTTALFSCDTAAGKVTRITGPELKVMKSCVYNGRFFFLANDMTGDIECNQSGIYEALPDGTVKCLYPAGQYTIRQFCAVNNGIMLCAAENRDLSPWFRLFDPDTGTITVVNEFDRSTGSSVGSDCRKGGGNTMVFSGDTLYFTATLGGSAVLCTLKDGKISTYCDADGSIDCFDISDKGEIIAICLSGQKLQELYMLSEGTFRQLTNVNEAILEGKYVAKPQRLAISSEGFDIEGWVLYPADYDPEKKYPAVLDIHGGPKTAYGTVFVHEMQLWANEGYFVFFCNPAGSDGYGDKFSGAIFGGYGTVDYKNIMDFTDAVLEKYPQIDAKRVAVTGGSYGGYMTNWIIGHTNRFACAATQRSISNWVTMEAISDIGYHFAKEQIHAEFMSDVEKAWEQSPLKYADNFATPTLLIHSDCDFRCPIPEGYQLFYALKKKNVPSRMVVFHGENHELSRSGKPQHRLRRLREITDWFAKYTK